MKLSPAAGGANPGRFWSGNLGGEETDMYYHDENERVYNDDYGGDFADPGGRSALRAASRNNPRNLPCPTCGQPNKLTPADVRQGYQCDRCADRDEGIEF